MRLQTPVGSQLQQALVMASMVSLRNDLAVELGDWWAFNWKTNVITIPQRELEERPAERIAWIILHEAAHAAVTRFHEILPAGILDRPEIHMLLNTIEDIRIELWLVDRFPGARPWRAVCRAVDAELEKESQDSAEKRTVMAEFLSGVFALAEGEPPAGGTSQTVLEALEQIRPSLVHAVECRPPVNTTGNEVIARLYRAHPVSTCYAYVDAKAEPDSFEKWVRVMQATSWMHILGGILPVYMRLLNLPPVRQIGMETIIQKTSLGAGTEKRSLSQMQQDLRRELAQLTGESYWKVAEENRSEIQRITRLLEDLLPNHRGLRHVSGCRSGDRLHLRTASQAEADPRLLEKLWMRRTRRTLPDPAFVFVMDRSSSMKGASRSGAAYASLVMVREACTRSKIPFAVIAFNDHAAVIHDWDRMNDTQAQAALELVLRPDHGTNLAGALEAAQKLIAPRPERDRFIFVLTDGDISPDQTVEVQSIRKSIEETGVHCAAIGLGVEPEGFHRVFPNAPILHEAPELPGVLGDLLVSVQVQAA